MNKLQTQLRDSLGLLIIGAERAGLSEQEIKEVIEYHILGEFELTPNNQEPLDVDFNEVLTGPTLVDTLIRQGEPD